MHVNNETGTIQNIQKIAEETASRGILFHTDATQSIGKLSFNIHEIPVDLISFSAHKIYGPKGVGALYIRRKPRVKLLAEIHGGGQEQGMRGGTLPTHQIIGMGAACAIAKTEMHTSYDTLYLLREKFLQAFPQCQINGSVKDSFPGIVNLSFPGKIAKHLMDVLPELAFSVGSACLSKNEPSHVLQALGLNTEMIQAAIRFSFGKFTKIEELDFAIHALQKKLK
ncbi:MAG TPA: aminotransferase class V-fold PLP-dependent enzyme, partial [Gammaproteobacteria bacterium]|jgi:cysteine desulfurase|nr:aminotransferase class V-fold PLP-dependent enzyme [Gammaproteobacteria bacterium]